MTFGWKALLFFVIVDCTAARRHPVYLYSAALIQRLADQSTGIFDCWTFRLSNDPLDTMDKLLQSGELASIPKKVMSLDDSCLTYERQPKLLLKKLSSYLLQQEFENSLFFIKNLREPSSFKSTAFLLKQCC